MSRTKSNNSSDSFRKIKKVRSDRMKQNGFIGDVQEFNDAQQVSRCNHIDVKHHFDDFQLQNW